MIGYLEGKILKKEADRILLLAGAVGYEVMLPAFVMESMADKSIGDEVALHIYFHQTERQPKPVLIGFALEAEREFFQHFISVEDIGPMKAVKALEMTVREIAVAIETGDTAKLKRLKGIGPRTAGKIVASLRGKMEKFALIRVADAVEPPPTEDLIGQVIRVLTEQLGHSKAEARQLIAEAMGRDPSISTAEALFEEIYRGAVDS
jgi:Holliday junction DNA helicase RuvA